MRKGEVENDNAREENLENIMSWEAPIRNRVVLRELAMRMPCSAQRVFPLNSMSPHVFIHIGLDFTY